MAFDYAKAYQQFIDEELVAASATAWMIPEAGKVRFTGGRDVEISTLSTSGLSNYDATKSDGSAYPSGTVSNDWTTYTLSMDRGVKFALDRTSPNDTGFLATAEKPGFGLKVTVFAGLTNVVLDFLLVYVLPFGLAGAALATALSQAVGAAIPLVYFLRENDTPLRLGRPCFDLRALWRACYNGSSEMVSNLSGSLVGILYNVQLMAIAQEDGVSAYGVLMYVDFIFKAFFFGYSIAVTPVVGYHYGAQNHAELKSLLRKSLIITVLVSLVMTGASVTLAGPIADLFVGYDAALHDMTVNALRVYSVSFLVFGFNIFGSAFFTGLNDGTDSALISFLRTLVFQVAAILLLPRWLDINGIWLAVTAAESLTLLVTVSLLAAKRRKYHY